MGSLKMRIVLFLVWLASGAGMLAGAKLGSLPLGGLCALLFFPMGLGVGIILFGDPLPPKESQICASCREHPATTCEHYWVHGTTIPDGAVALCGDCAQGYDPNRDWSKAKGGM